ncbi:Phosphoesterase, PA-phosphatase related protein [Candidatus Saccharibacteria bacterium RAAC3_TM7_1]|nr:Phosphoesterase, PA-phosphatase related protein [Candidatus Saccharibacteria bacterium RAAC3_TM7_1]HCZ28860.1 phosphatase PAP2 family protein [Candidatus Saccharibacteria bacterium]
MLETLVKIMADGLLVPVLLLGGWALLFRVPKDGRYRAYCRILMAGLTAYVFAKLIGSIYQPEFERPFEQLGLAAGASFLNNPGFPSDHILFCTTITLAVWFETRMKWLSLILAILTATVAVGRVLALVHTPIDVLGGVVIASLGALWYLQRDSTPKPRHIRHWSRPQTNATIRHK